ncbi:hypothetical protein ACFQ3N_16600 [Virgibacillus byunsanensis]|uniref:Uncharacterized protein n=1 Tax=Virgibacillus byunsanensis TaxID=570945 RepID=A0ABW3LR65_9BACI
MNLVKWLEDDVPFGLNDEIEKIFIFRCLDCKGTDEVPEYIIDEFSVDLNEGEKSNYIVHTVYIEF